jgi:peroxisomal membrane protein 2
MSFSKPSDDDSGPLAKLLQGYIRLLKEKPLLTKACTSACTGALGNLLSQYLRPSQGSPKHIDWCSVLNYAITGFVLVAPLMHNYYRLVEKFIPIYVSQYKLKRLLVDRLLYTPAFLVAYLYFMCLVEGCGPALARKKVEAMFWIIYTMNLKILTVIQFINLSYVPPQYRVLFGNAVSILWSCYVASKRSS